MVCKTRQGKRLTKLAEGGSTSTASSLLGSYTPTVGTTYDESNPYTYGMGAERVYDFNKGSNLIKTDTTPVNIYDTLSQDAKWYLGKKWGKWSNTDEDTGIKGIADTLADINKIIAYKGGNISTSNKTANVEAALAPLVAKRKASGKGFGKILSTVAPIALSFIPGVGTAVGAALGAGAAFAPAVGSAVLGAGAGALTSGLTGGNVLKSALMGGVTGGVGGYLNGVGGLTGLSSGAVKATSGPLAGQWVIPGVMNSASNTATVSNLLNGIPNSVGRLATTGEKILGSIAGTGSNNALSSYGRIGNLVSKGTSLLGNSSGATQQQQGTSSTGGFTQEQLQQLAAYLQQNGARTNSGGVLSLVNRASGGSIPETDSSSVGGLQSNRMVVGNGDGMSDSVPAVINGSRPAALSDGEHVVPALQTSLLGRGSSSAGSKRISELIKSEIKDMYGNIDPVKLQTKAMRTNKKGNH